MNELHTNSKILGCVHNSPAIYNVMHTFQLVVVFRRQRCWYSITCKGVNSGAWY